MTRFTRRSTSTPPGWPLLPEAHGLPGGIGARMAPATAQPAQALNTRPSHPSAATPIARTAADTGQLPLPGFDAQGTGTGTGTCAAAGPGAQAGSEAATAWPEGVLVMPQAQHHARGRPGDRLHALFEQRCRALREAGASDTLAIEGSHLALRYDELDALANRLAHLLAAQGRTPGDRIGLVLDKGHFSCAAMLAVGKLEAVYVPMDPGFPADRIAFICEDAGVAQVLTTSRHRALVEQAGLPVLYLDEADADLLAQPDTPLAPAAQGAPAPRADATPDGDALCYIIYTSGSTGRPKGVPIGHAQIVNFVQVAAEVYGYAQGDRVYQGLTLAFDFAVEEVWVPLVLGCTLVPNDTGANLLGADLGDFLRERRITALCCVPTLLATLEEELPALRLLIVSGEACPRDLVQRWHRPGRRFLNAYGPTEATVTATLGQPAPDRPVTIGRPLPTYAIVILPPGECRALPFGQEGEIGIAGIGVANGYLNREAQTRAAFIPDALQLPHNPSGLIYRTGDLGRINAHGEVEYLGRIDTQVKIRGYRIELAEIESQLMQCDGVAQAVVNPWSSSPGVVELVAYYTASHPERAPDPAELAAALSAHLPPYMCPAFFERLDAMPMLASDKADRKALPPPASTRLALDDGAYEAPADALEAAIAQEVAGLLGLPRVSVTAHFFQQLGMSSLLLARLAARLRHVVPGGAVSMRALYGSADVRRLAASLREASEDEGTRGATAPDGGAEAPHALEPHRATRAAYLACGAAQVALMALWLSGHAAALWEGIHLVLEAADWATAWMTALAFAVVYSSVSALLPIGLKWLLVGRMKPGRIRAWSPAYLRFWCVRALVRTNWLVLTAGTPLYAAYLRALGARIDPTAWVALEVPPACPDMLSVGAQAVVHPHVNLAGYRVRSGWVEIGPVGIGERAVVGDWSVLDIHTGLSAGAELAHASSLHSGQRVPPGEHWHGSPAQKSGRVSTASATASAAGLEPLPSRARRRAFGAAQWAVDVLVLAPLPALAAFALWGEAGHALDAAGAGIADMGSRASAAATGPQIADGIRGLAEWLALGAGVYLAAWLGLLAWAATVPRWVAQRLLRPGRRYPLYGWHHWWLRFVRTNSNIKPLNTLLGDASAIVHYLRAIGWRLPGLKQTGSNFGLAQQHDVPTLITVGSGTMVSDGLTLLNARWDARGFELQPNGLGASCFLGNAIIVPTDHRVGDDCLLASKVMLPTDGAVRSGVGLLGSPPIEIPRRSSLGDPAADEHAPAELARLLKLKNRSNVRTMAMYLMAQAAPLAVLAIAWHELYALGDEHGAAFAAVFAVGAAVFILLWFLFIDAASRGFRPLQPRRGSIYDRPFWRHERHWKLGLSQDNPLLAALAGTPLRGWIWRRMGVQVGRQLLDDGCAITEKTLTRLGDHCTLGGMTTLQGHSLEDGHFLSGRLWFGDGVSVGTQCYVHYDTRLDDRGTVLADAFVMKGTQIAAGECWIGNPAQPMPQRR